MPIDPDILNVRPGDDRAGMESESPATMLSFDLATPDTAPDEWQRAAARRLSEAVGLPDPDGRVWHGRPSATGAEYLGFMRGMLKSGDIWEYAATPELKAFHAADDAGKAAIARSALGRADRAAAAIGRLVPEGYGFADGAPELAGAPEDVLAANARLRADQEERRRYSREQTARSEPFRAARPREEIDADRAGLDAWRRRREDAELVSGHQERLLKDNLWAAWLSVAPALSDSAREIAARVFRDSKLTGSDIAGFQRLDETEQAAVARLARLSRDPAAGTFWNTLGDAGIGFVNGVAQLPVNAAKQIGTLTTTIDQAVFGPDAGLVDNDEMNRRARTEQRLREALDDAPGINPTGAEHGYIARSLIGAVSTLPYMGYASMGLPGFTSVALDFMQRLDERIAADGGDVYGRSPEWVAQKAVYGALYAGIEKLSALPIFKETSDIALKTAFLKLATRHGAGAAQKVAVHVGKESLTETLEEAVQAVIEEHAASVGLGRGAGWREAARAGVREFAETAGTMGLVALAGTARQGVQARSGKGRAALAEFAPAAIRREAFILSDNPYAGRGGAAAIDEAWLGAAMQLDIYRTQWQQGGRQALEARGDLTAGQAAVLDNVFEGEREGREAGEFVIGRNLAARADADASGAVYEELDAPRVREAVREAGPDAERRLQDMGFTETGAARVAGYFRQEEARRRQWGRVLDDIRASLARDFEAGADTGDGRTAALDRLADIQPLREVYQRAGTRQGAVNAFKELRFTREQAERLAEAFHEERAFAVSPEAAAAFRAFYLDTSAEESAERRLGRMTGFEAAPAPEHGEGARRLTVRDGGGAVRGEILFLPETGTGFDPEGPHAGEAVEQATRGQPFAITEAEWNALTPERRAAFTREHIRPMGSFAVTDPADPSVRADGIQADTLTGTITLGPDAPSAELYHEAAHAWLAVMRRAGKISDADVARLREAYGPSATDPKWFNEEAFADDIREIGAATDYTPDKPLARRFIDAVRRFAGAARSEEARRTAAAGARQAIYESIVYGTPFEGAGDFGAVPKAASGTAPGADPTAGAATAKPAAEASGTRDGSGTAEQPTEKKTPEAEKQEGRPPIKKDPAKRPRATWTAATPQGNVRVAGHWMVAPRDRFISDTDPRYDFSLQNRTRDATVASAAQVAGIAAPGVFDPLRLTESPDTANGAPMVKEVTLKGASGKDETFYMIISGNGRFRALDLVDEDNRGDEYRDPVQAFADERGIPYDPAGMTAAARPRLVRVLTRRPAGVTLQKVAQLSNQNAVLQMSDAERASADAELIARDGAAGLYSANKDGMPSRNGSDEFFTWFINAAGDASLVDSKGNPTDAARERGRRAMLALAIGRGRRGKETVAAFTENAAGLGLERQRDALLMSAGTLSALGDLKPGYALADEMSRAAADMLMLSRERRRKAGKNTTADEFIAQGDMIDAPPPVSAELLRLLDSGRTAEDMAAALQRYVELASKIDTDTADMFGEPPSPKEELLKKAAADTRNLTQGVRYSVAIAARRYALATGMPAEGEKLLARQLEFLFARHMDPAYRDSRARAAETRRRNAAAAERAKGEAAREATARALRRPDSPEAWREAFDASGETVSRIIHQFFMPDGPQRFPGEYRGRQLRGLKIKTSADAAALLMPLRNPYQESMKAIFLDAGNRVLGAEVCTVGLLDLSPVHPREVFKRGVELGAARVVFAHNHPSGDPAPSREDQAITDRLAEAGRMLGIEYTDHIITDGDRFYSFAAGEEMPFAGALRQSGGSHIHAVLLDTKNRVTAVARIPYSPRETNSEQIRAAVFRAAGHPTRGIILDLTADGIGAAEARFLHQTVGAAAQVMGLQVADTIYAEDGWAVSALDGRTGTRLLPLTAAAAESAETRHSLSAVTPAQDAAYMAAVGRGDTAEAQKMVDEAAKAAGYDTEAWHVTDAKFTKFDPEKAAMGGAFWFTSDRGATERGETGARLNPALPPNTVHAYLSLHNAAGREAYKTKGLGELKRDGYDGVSLEGDFIVFRPEQIKSADPVTYDDDGNVIPLSERFTPESLDIRYSLAASADPAFAWMRDYYDESWGEEQAGPDRAAREASAREAAAAAEAAHTHPNGKRKDTWMKAPNGKPTNLTARQWAQVRTPAFKAWFGDWENDPANASKVVDENGEPLVVYHGTTAAGFAVFRMPRGQDGRDLGHYFSRRPVTAATYSGMLKTVDAPGEPEYDGDGRPREAYEGVYPVFLNIRDPKEWDFDGRKWNRHPDGDRWTVGYDMTGAGFVPFYKPDGTPAVFDNETQAREMLPWAKAERPEKTFRVQRAVATTRELVDRAASSGADGAVFRNVVDTGGFDVLDEDLNPVDDDSVNFGDDVYVAFSGFQIKSANANTGAFSPSTDDIRYSVQAAEPKRLISKIRLMTSPAAMLRHPDYTEAKAGGREAAVRVVSSVAKADKLRALAADHPDAVLVPIQAEEAAGRNQLPAAFAGIINAVTGLKVDYNIVQSVRAHRTGKGHQYRMENRPQFAGDVIQGQEYILVDDLAAMGGTLAELRHYIETRGGIVVDAVTLAAGRFGNIFGLTPQTEAGLIGRFGVNYLQRFLKRRNLYGGNWKYLSEGEGRELLKALPPDAGGDGGIAGRGSQDRTLHSGTPGTDLGGDGDQTVRYAIDVTGRAYPKEDLLTGFMAHAALTGAAFPSPATIARLAEKIGVKSFNYERLAEAARRLAEETADEAIRKAAVSPDPDKTAYAIGELARRAARAYVRAGAREGAKLWRSAERIRALSEDGVKRAMQAVTGADYADVETDTEIDLAASILAADPKAFEPRKERERAEAAGVPADAEPDPETQGDPDARPLPETDEEAPGLTDKQRAEIARKRREREARIQALLDAARERGSRNRFRDEERRRRREAEEKAAAEERAGSGAGGAGGEAAAGKPTPAAPAAEPAAPVDITDRWEAAALLRVWAFDRFRRDNPLRQGETRDPAKDRVAVEFYRKTAVRTLTDLARKLLEPGAPRESVRAMIADITPGLTANQIERRTAHVFGTLNRHAVREERRSLVRKFRAEIKRQFVKGEKFEELGVDLGRTLTGAVEEDARYVMRVCELSGEALDGDTSALARERARLNSVIAEREGLTDQEGNPLPVGDDDMRLRMALRQLALLDKYGGMTDMMPGEILDLSGAALADFAQEAVELRRQWEAYDNIVKAIREPLTAAITRGPDDPQYREGAAGALADSLTGMLRLRLDFLTRYADPAKREAGRAAIADFMDLLARGNTDFAVAMQDDEASLNRALGEIFHKENGQPDRRRIRAYLGRMDERIPRELAARLTLQGHQDTMTYGQMLQLLASLDQWASYKDNIILHGRKEQAALIRSFRFEDPKTGEVRPALTSEDIQLLEWLRRRHYGEKRTVINAVTQRIAGRGVDSPDPLYHPVRMLQQKKAGLHVGAGGWQPLAGVFSRRVKNRLDFDETASILDVFRDRARETALLTAYSERGMVIREVLTSRPFQDALRRFHGPAALTRILKQVEQTLNGGRPRTQTDAQAAAGSLAARVTTYIGLGWNLQSAAKQSVSIPVFAARIGFRNLGRILISPPDREAVRRLRESDEYRARYGTGPASGMDIGTRAAYESPDASIFKRFFADWGLGPNRKVDWFISAWVGQAVYRDLKSKYLDQGMSEEAADRRAVSETFSLIEETQQSGRTENATAMTREYGVLGKLLTQFATSPLQQMQYELKAFREWRDLADNSGPETNVREARNQFMRALFINHVIIPGLMAAVVGLYKAATGSEPDWEKEGFWWTLVIAAIMGQFGRVFFAGALAEQTLRVLFLRQPPRMGQLVPAEGVIRFAGNLAYPVRDIATWDTEHLQGDLMRALKSVAVTRLPVTVYENFNERD